MREDTKAKRLGESFVFVVVQVDTRVSRVRVLDLRPKLGTGRRGVEGPRRERCDVVVEGEHGESFHRIAWHGVWTQPKRLL